MVRVKGSWSSMARKPANKNHKIKKKKKEKKNQTIKVFVLTKGLSHKFDSIFGEDFYGGAIQKVLT